MVKYVCFKSLACFVFFFSILPEFYRLKPCMKPQATMYIRMSGETVFNSRRSPVICCNGCAASTQPLASQIGVGKQT